MTGDAVTQCARSPGGKIKCAGVDVAYASIEHPVYSQRAVRWQYRHRETNSPHTPFEIVAAIAGIDDKRPLWRQTADARLTHLFGVESKAAQMSLGNSDGTLLSFRIER